MKNRKFKLVTSFLIAAILGTVLGLYINVVPPAAAYYTPRSVVDASMPFEYRVARGEVAGHSYLSTIGQPY